jgi:hypothetical protein
MRPAHARLRLSGREPLWIISALSNFGTWMHNTAAAAQLARSSPSPLINALLLAAAAAVLAVFAVRGLCDGLGPVVILVLTFALNAGWAAGYPAWNAEVSSVLPADLVKDGSALNSLSFNLARTLGPAAGGFAFGAVGGFPVYFANALSFAGFVLCFRKSRTVVASNVAGSWRDSLRETTAFLRATPQYRDLLVRATTCSCTGLTSELMTAEQTAPIPNAASTNPRSVAERCRTVRTYTGTSADIA